MTPMVQCTNYCINFIFISGVPQNGILQFLAKECYIGHPPWLSTAPMPDPEASHWPQK